LIVELLRSSDIVCQAFTPSCTSFARGYPNLPPTEVNLKFSFSPLGVRGNVIKLSDLMKNIFRHNLFYPFRVLNEIVWFFPRRCHWAGL